MADNNSYKMLDEDASSSSEITHNQRQHQRALPNNVHGDSQIDGQGWTDYQSSKSRRLAPQSTISMQDMSDKKPAHFVVPLKQSNSTPATQFHHAHPTYNEGPSNSSNMKRKVLRFSKEELLSLRRVTMILPDLPDLNGIFSAGALEPETAQPYDLEEILQVWNSSIDKLAKPGNGRGRVKKPYDMTNDGGTDNAEDMWDDNIVTDPANSGFDLADFSAATIKFNSEAKKSGPEPTLRQNDTLLSANISVEEAAPLWLGDKLSNVKIASVETTAGQIPLKSEIENTMLNGRGRGPQIDIQNKRSPKQQIVDHHIPALQPVNDLYDTTIRSVAHGQGQQLRIDLDSSPLYLQDASRFPISITQPSTVFDRQQIPQQLPQKWLYRDPQSNIQGPFDTTGMRRWLDSGYFKEHLPIKLVQWSGFYPLGVVFPDPELAFREAPVIEPSINQNPQRILQGFVQQPSIPQSSIYPPASHVPVHSSLPPEQSIHSTVDFPFGVRRDPPLAAPTTNVPFSSVLLPTAGLNSVNQVFSSQQISDSVRINDSESLLNQQNVVSQQEHVKSSKSWEWNELSQEHSNIAKGKQSLIISDKHESVVNPPLTSVVEKESTVKVVDQCTDRPKESSSNPWGNASQSKQRAAKSLIEIQKEEVASKELHSAENIETSSSLQLKQLLGVNPNSWQPAQKPWGSNNLAQSVTQPSLRDIQMEQMVTDTKQVAKQLQQHAPAPPTVDNSTSINLSSQWKASSNVKQTPKSLVDIMMEEALLANSSQSKSIQRSDASSWAAKVGAKGQAAPSETVQIAPSTDVKRAGQSLDPVKSTFQTNSDMSSKSTPLTSLTAEPNKPMTTAQVVAKAKSNNSSNADIMEWSEAQLKKLNLKKGTNDTTLLELCLTLESASEIREYLADYLGSTPQVSQFATEFIRRKEAKEGKGLHHATTSQIPSITQIPNIAAGSAYNTGKKKKSSGLK